ncbi:hypothetical protein PR048_024671 [Dryococelus australis]|uniref:Uncharacterized protein n=1 Tax=Dryococelus australis TaxID=614101 RepID=A0ABQ9GP77_9NEOP|nr:hypothetical protein PR048_024671 [Dryococelus australis]
MPPTTGLTGFNLRPGHLLFFASGNRAGRCCWSAGYLGELLTLACWSYSIPSFFHPHRLSSPRSEEPPKSLNSTQKAARAMIGLSKGAVNGRSRENPPNGGIVRHDSHTAPGVEPGLPWKEESSLTTTTPRPHQVNMKQRPNARAGEMGDPPENPPTSGIVRHDSDTRKSVHFKSANFTVNGSQHMIPTFKKQGDDSRSLDVESLDPGPVETGSISPSCQPACSPPAPAYIQLALNLRRLVLVFYCSSKKGKRWELEERVDGRPAPLLREGSAQFGRGEGRELLMSCRLAGSHCLLATPTTIVQRTNFDNSSEHTELPPLSEALVIWREGHSDRACKCVTTHSRQRLPPRRTRFDSRRGRSQIFRAWESCRMMPLVGGFPRGSPVSRQSLRHARTLIAMSSVFVRHAPGLQAAGRAVRVAGPTVTSQFPAATSHTPIG